MKKNHIILIGLFLFFLISSLFGIEEQKYTFSKADSLFELLSKHHKTMGTFMIKKGNEVIYSKAVGYQNIDKQIENNIDTKFRIGSISKMFTSVMIFQLIQEKKLSLDTKLSEYFPKIENAKDITIAMMLNHHSGIHSFTNDKKYLEWCTEKKSKKDMLKIIEKSKAVFKPGEKGEYSNSNYVLLAYIIEAIDQQNYQQSLEQRICKPLGLTNTYYGGDISSERNEAFSYNEDQGWKQEMITDMSIPSGAGAIVSNASDLCQFGSALFNGKLISEKSLNQMIEIKDEFGYGIFKYNAPGINVYGHGGGIDGFTTQLCIMPEENLYFVALSNGSVYPTMKIAFDMIKIYHHFPYTMPDFEVKDVKIEDLSIYTGIYQSKQINLKIKVSEEKGQLFAQADGQMKFPLSVADIHKFRFEKAGIEMLFKPELGEFILYQNSQEFLFKKE